MTFFEIVPSNKSPRFCTRSGADPEAISSTGTEEDSSLSDDDKHQDGSSDQELLSDEAASGRKDDESHIPVATTQPDTARSPDSCASRTSSRSFSSSRSELPGYESDNSATTSPQSPKNAETSSSESQRETEHIEAESSTEDIVEEVVYEEVVLEEGDDLESILGHGSFLKGTKDARLRTVSSHKDDPGDKDNDVMVIEREEREEQSQVNSIPDGGEGRGDGLETAGDDIKQTGEGSSAELTEPDVGVGTMESVTSTLTGSSTADAEGHLRGASVSEDNLEDAECDPRLELEEGEIEDSSTDLEDDQLDEEVQMESREDDPAMENVKKARSPEVVASSLKAKGTGKKKKVKVIKRIIKVIRKKPKLEGQGNPAVSKELAKKLKVTHQTKYRQDSETPDKYVNEKIKATSGAEQSTSYGAGSSNQSKSNSRSSGHARLKTDPSAAVVTPGQSDLTPVSEKSLNQMEILELEMRARAIKAMLKKQEEKEKRLDADTKKRIKLKRKMTEN